MVACKVRFGVLAGILCAVALAMMCTLGLHIALADESPDPFASGAEIDLPDGAYSVDVVMEGGSGRASIDSPALLTVKDGHAAATVRWSSPNYDYMLVNGQKYLPANEDPMANSEFQIPVLAFDEPFAVVGDTTAMSSPHEVDYTFTFALGSVIEGAPAAAEAAAPAAANEPAQGTSAGTSAPVAEKEQKPADEDGIPIVPIVAVIVVVIVAGAAIGIVRGRKNR